MMPVQEWIDDPDEPEIALEGGDVTEGLVRRGATIRRPSGDHSQLVRQLLRHL
jgi:hypothetical protein